MDVDAGRGLALEGVASSVKGSGTEAEMASRQDRVGEFETPTQGYTVCNGAAGVRFTFGGRLNVLIVSLANAANTEYRNHLSRVKEIMPEAARSLNVNYRVVF